MTSRDFEAVQALLDEVREDERLLHLAKAIVAWLTAFKVFKRLERRIGLPTAEEGRLVYGGIVGQLKGVGKWLLATVGRKPETLELLELKYEDLAARVRELSWDDDWAENPITPAERDQLDQVFAEPKGE